MTDETVRLKREVRELQQALEAERNKPPEVVTETQQVEVPSQSDRRMIEQLRSNLQAEKDNREAERKEHLSRRTQDAKLIRQLRNELEAAQTSPRQQDLRRIKDLQESNRQLQERAEYHRRLKQ